MEPDDYPLEADYPDWERDELDQEWAGRWMDAWDRLEPYGIVGPGDENMTVHELERLVDLLGLPGRN